MLSIEGRIVNANQTHQGRIEINTDTGLIENVIPATGQADIVLGNDYFIFPGFGDMHIHAREDSSGTWNYKEDFLSTSKAAIHGGVGFAMDMTNNPVPLITEELYLERKKLCAEKSSIDIILAAPIGPSTKPFSFPTPYKLFMTHSVGDLFFTNKSEIEKAVSSYEGQQINFHCEDPEVLEKYKNETTHTKQRPPEAEISGIQFALEIIEKYNLKGRICHLTTKQGLKLIAAAKNRGVNVVCEVTPHHLYFNSSAELQMNPPLRTDEDRNALIEGLKNGDIDFLATDHAPHSKEEIKQGVSGLPHLDTYGSFTTWLMTEQGFSPEDIARVCSANPGKYFEQFSTSKYGQITTGFTGSLAIINMTEKAHILKEKLQTKSHWSPFLGKEFAGLVKYAIIRGKVYTPND